MTEADENTLRVLLSRLREEDPAAFTTMLIQTLLNRIGDNVILGIRHKDDAGNADALICIFNGERVAGWAEEALRALQHKLDKEVAADEDDEHRP